MKNREYWQRRAEDMIIASELSVLEYEERLLQAYDVALVNIRKEIDAFFAKYAAKNKIPYADVRKRLNLDQAKSFRTLLKEWYEASKVLNLNAEYQEYLKALSSRVYITRLEELTANIRYEIEKLADNKLKGIETLSAINYMVGYYTSAYNFAKGAEFDVDFATIDKIGIDKAIKTRFNGQNYSDSIWKDKQALLAAMDRLLPQSFSRGLSSIQIGDQIARELGTSKNRGRALARTEINFLCNQAALDVYKVAGLIKYEYLATLDSRTSEICRDLDGKVELVSRAEVGINYPPMHPHCRSTTIPYFEGEEDLTPDRVARNEDNQTIRVPRRMTQEAWIKKYVPEDQQDTMLNFVGKYKPKGE